MQPAMNNRWVLLRNAPGPQHASSRVMLPNLHTWPKGKDLPLMSPWHGGSGAFHGPACEEHLSAILHATTALVSAGNDAWRGNIV